MIRKRLYTLCLIAFCSNHAIAQVDFGLSFEYGLSKSIYQMESSSPAMKAPREFVIPFGLGISATRKRFTLNMLYENRSFKETGPRYPNDVSIMQVLGGRGFPPDRIHSINILFGVDLLPNSAKFQLVPEIGAGAGYMFYAIVKNRAPTFQDSTNYGSFATIDNTGGDSLVLLQGQISSHYTSSHMVWARAGLTFSYRFTNRWETYVRMAYTHGFTPFHRAIFRVEDINLAKPINGTISYSGNTLAMRFGISYSFIRKQD